MTTGRRLLGAAAGLLADRVLGEPPPAVHPVAAFGRLMGGVEQRLYRDARDAGMAYAALGIGIGLAAGVAARSTAVAVGTASAGRMLRDQAGWVRDRLDAGDLDGAREALPALVGRDPSVLDVSGVAAAVIESVAENTVDAVVAPAVWGVALGAPGAMGYRAVNTMDAMVGHRSDRYEHFGWASARADDVAGYLPARITAVLVCLAAPARARAAMAAVRRGAAAHPSPNAGVAEAAFAGALGIELGGMLQYGARTERRPLLGGGPRPGPDEIGRAVALASRVELTLMGLLGMAGLALAIGDRR